MREKPPSKVGTIGDVVKWLNHLSRRIDAIRQPDAWKTRRGEERLDMLTFRVAEPFLVGVLLEDGRPEALPDPDGIRRRVYTMRWSDFREPLRETVQGLGLEIDDYDRLAGSLWRWGGDALIWTEARGRGYRVLTEVVGVEE